MSDDVAVAEGRAWMFADANLNTDLMRPASAYHLPLDEQMKLVRHFEALTALYSKSTFGHPHPPSSKEILEELQRTRADMGRWDQFRQENQLKAVWRKGILQRIKPYENVALIIVGIATAVITFLLFLRPFV